MSIRRGSFFTVCSLEPRRYAGAPNFRTNPNTVILNYDPPLASKAPGIAAHRARALRGDLDMILAKALEKQVSRRCQTVEELSAEIKRFLEGRPVKARANSQIYTARRFVRRNRVPVTAAALLALAVSGGIAGTLLYARRAEREKEVAVKRLGTLRRISESLLFEFNDSIKDLPSATPARALVVRRALEYLDEVAAEDSSDPAVQRDLAAAYIRIGNLLSVERGPHIGGPDAMANSIKGYERALAIWQALVEGHPEDHALRQDLIESSGWLHSHAANRVISASRRAAQAEAGSTQSLRAPGNRPQPHPDRWPDDAQGRGSVSELAQGLVCHQSSSTSQTASQTDNCPVLDFKGLEIDTKGHFIAPDTGQFTLAHPVDVDLDVLKVEITNFSFGNDTDNSPYILFDGGVNVGEGLPAQAEVDFQGVKLASNGTVSLQGLEVKADVADILRIDASLNLTGRCPATICSSVSAPASDHSQMPDSSSTATLTSLSPQTHSPLI